MLNLGSWSFARVLGVSFGWIVLAMAIYAVRIYVNARWVRSDGVGSIGASMGLGPVVPILFGPPALLLVIWLGWKLWRWAV